MRHENASPKASPFGKVGHGRCVIEMKVRYEKHINLFGLYSVEKGESIHSVVTWMDSAIQHYGHAPEL
jgi:hypothetical protein